MIELIEGLWVIPEDVKVVKRIGDDKCAFWVTGQSAMDGFVVDAPAEKVVAALDGYDDDEGDDNDRE